MRVEKIFVLTNTLKNGGAEKQSVLLAAALRNQYDVNLIVYYGDEIDDKLLKLADAYNIKVIKLKNSHFNKWIKLFNLFRNNKNSVIFSYLATTNFVNAIIGKAANVKYLVGGIRSAKFSKFKLGIQRFLHNHLLNYSIFNNYQGQLILSENGFSNKKSLVIHNCIDIKQKKRINQITNDQINIITIGRFVHAKDYFTAIKSVKKLLKLITDAEIKIKIKYNIIGYGFLENEIRDYIKEENLNEFVELIINPANPESYLLKSNIYLSTSIVEGLSNSIMEAMEYSLPIVATDVGDNKYLIDDGFNGYLMQIKNDDLISEKLFHLIKNPELITEMGVNSFTKLKQQFTMKVFLDNYLKLITKLEGFKKI